MTGLPQPPSRTEAKGATQIPAARRQRGDGGDMIRFQRMTHADEEAENENTTHGGTSVSASLMIRFPARRELS